MSNIFFPVHNAQTLTCYGVTGGETVCNNYGPVWIDLIPEEPKPKKPKVKHYEKFKDWRRRTRK